MLASALLNFILATVLEAMVIDVPDPLSPSPLNVPRPFFQAIGGPQSNRSSCKSHFSQLLDIIGRDDYSLSIAKATINVALLQNCLESVRDDGPIPLPSDWWALDAAICITIAAVALQTGRCDAKNPILTGRSARDGSSVFIYSSIRDSMKSVLHDAFYKHAPSKETWDRHMVSLMFIGTLLQSLHIMLKALEGARGPERAVDVFRAECWQLEQGRPDEMQRDYENVCRDFCDLTTLVLVVSEKPWRNPTKEEKPSARLDVSDAFNRPRYLSKDRRLSSGHPVLQSFREYRSRLADIDAQRLRRLQERAHDVREAIGDPPHSLERSIEDLDLDLSLVEPSDDGRQSVPMDDAAARHLLRGTHDQFPHAFTPADFGNDDGQSWGLPTRFVDSYEAYSRTNATRFEDDFLSAAANFELPNTALDARTWNAGTQHGPTVFEQGVLGSSGVPKIYSDEQCPQSATTEQSTAWSSFDEYPYGNGTLPFEQYPQPLSNMESGMSDFSGVEALRRSIAGSIACSHDERRVSMSQRIDQAHEMYAPQGNRGRSDPAASAPGTQWVEDDPKRSAPTQSDLYAAQIPQAAHVQHRPQYSSRVVRGGFDLLPFEVGQRPQPECQHISGQQAEYYRAHQQQASNASGAVALQDHKSVSSRGPPYLIPLSQQMYAQGVDAAQMQAVPGFRQPDPGIYGSGMTEEPWGSLAPEQHQFNATYEYGRGRRPPDRFC